ncbi:hypothetical protein BKA70DRAFT_872782 [Coprinopsis sp. MPI-PUGE-AT-0042]|nr:hypothetical protein BKA70DRAFT_872782 [Coprinopsis sp. MPI-PUGE-AT-0042]
MEEHLQVSSSRSQRLSVISKSEQVQVSDSQFTVAGGHITNFAVNIAFNPQPTESVSPTSWSTLLGQWLGRPYSFSKPLHELGSAPLPRPTQAPEGGRGNSMYPPLYEHATAGTSCEWRDSSDDFVFVSLEGPKPHDIYFRQLYPRSDGYPCANPRPRGRPVKLGDIGFLYGGRFCVLQNLETLPESVLQGKPIPPPLQRL